MDTWPGIIYVGFVVDVFSRAIVERPLDQASFIIRMREAWSG
ncbi:hypothetical protein ACIHIX_24725 [Streptomyces sp. NPDC051913]